MASPLRRHPRGGNLQDDPVDGRATFLGWSLPMSRPSFRFDRADLRPASWPNVALAAACCSILTIAVLFGEDPEAPPQGVSPLGFVAAFVPLALIAWRPRIGAQLLAVSLVCWVVAAAFGADSGPDVAVFVAIYTIGTQRPWRHVAVAIGASVVVGTLAGVVGGTDATPGLALARAIATAISSGVAAGIGLFVGRRRSYIRTLIERTTHLERERDTLERERELLAREAVAVERARIARELHDVVAHHVSVMVIQAGAAQASLPAEAGAAGQAVEAIRETGREALAEMRRMLGLLRSEASFDPAGEDPGEGDPGGGEGSDAARTPQPGLKDLESLAARTRDAGVGVEVETSGSARRLPPGVDLSAYRIVQEALTNTLRHTGPGSRALVRVAYEPEGLTVEIVDDGLGRHAASAVERPRRGVGHGLVGMRERVAIFGGKLETGPLAGGGFRVMARFPLEPAPPEGGPSGAANASGGGE